MPTHCCVPECTKKCYQKDDGTNSGKGVTLPLNSWKRGYGPPPLVLTFTDDLPLCGLSPPPPRKNVPSLIPASPQHLCQKLSSEIVNSSGFLPRREAPGISFSVRNVGFEIFGILATANEEGHNAMAFLTSFSCNSIQDVRAVPHHESRV